MDAVRVSPPTMLRRVAPCALVWGALLIASSATAAPAPQRVLPLRDFAVRIVTPVDGEVVGGRVEIRAEVSADRPDEVLFVEFEIDGRLLFSDARPPYELIWKAGDVDSRRIVARAWGPTGQVVEDAVRTAGPPSTAAETAFRTRVEQVEVYVRVEGRGADVSLDKADFRVYEDGAEQPVVAVERTLDLPLALGFMVDCSGSMMARLDVALETAGAFIAGLLTRGHDKAFVLAFADLPAVLQEFTNDVPRLEDALQLISRGKYTKLYDSVVAATSQFRGHEGRRALVLLTDGHDAGSDAALDDAVRAAQQSDVIIYPVAVDLSRRFFFEHWVLERLARSTGGRVFTLRSMDDPVRIYEAIAEDLRTQYRLTYEPDAPGGDGSWRPIEVRLASSADRPGTRVRARPGYFAR